MGAFKQFTSKDVIVSPLTVHTDVTNISHNSSTQFSGSNLSSNVTGTFPTIALNGDGEVGLSILNPTLVFNSIKHLFYSNYLSKANNEDGLPITGLVSNVGTASFNVDSTIEGPIYTPAYLNYPTSMNERRYFPTQSGVKIAVSTIKQKGFGDYIKPGSVTPTFTPDGGATTTFIDNGEGEIVDADGNIYGNIFYHQGIAVFTGISGSGSGNGKLQIDNYVSSYTIYETQYKCTIRSNEFNCSLNPSLLSASIRGQNKILESGSSQYVNFATSSEFSPYVTTVGLYNDSNELIAVAKLAQPLETSQTTDTTILINIDR
jgi:hypothetical protein